jgi:hypothetical protein
LDGDEFRYEYSSDGTVFQEARLVSSSFFEDSDRVYELPASLAGTVTVRVVDTDRTPGQGAAQDTVSVDELFLRSVP